MGEVAGAAAAQVPTIGRIVHVGIGRDAGGLIVTAPAIVMHVAPMGPGDFLPQVEVRVFLRRHGAEAITQGTSFTPLDAEHAAGLAWREAVPFGHRVGEWHWPERA